MKMNLIYTKWASILVLIWSFSGLISTTYAESTNSSSNEWHFELTPYIWATSQDGKVGLDNRPGNGIAVNQDFSDILKRMDIAGMVAFDARYQRWGLLLDAIYLKVSDHGGVSGPNGFVSLSGRGDVTQKLFSIAGYYRALEGKTNLDAVLGIRYHAVDWDGSALLSTPRFPLIFRRFDERKSWIDPYIGFRVQYELDNHWSLSGYADIGGSGSGSNLTWQALAGVNYAFTTNIIGKFGYRHSYYDYHNDDFKYDMKTSGFYVGLGFRW